MIKGQGRPRKVYQFHFTAWPDKGVPSFASSLVQFRHKVNTTPVRETGPAIVHCRYTADELETLLINIIYVSLLTVAELVMFDHPLPFQRTSTIKSQFEVMSISKEFIFS